jgi:outer membrane murein-binding lipoprotein Lpp
MDLNAIRGRIVAVAKECDAPQSGSPLRTQARQLAQDAKNLADEVDVLRSEVERLRGERVARELDEANARIRRLGAENDLLRAELAALGCGDE